MEKMAKLPVVPIPGGLRFQPVDSREVADRLLELTLGPPAGLVPALAGPGVYGLADLVRGYLDARNTRRLLVPVRMPGQAGRAYRAGQNLAPRGGDVGRRTWEDFLAERVGSGRLGGGLPSSARPVIPGPPRRLRRRGRPGASPVAGSERWGASPAGGTVPR